VRKILRLLLITGGLHPYHQTTPIITKTLRKRGHKVRVTKSAKELAEKSMAGFDAIVLNTWRRNTFVEDVEHLRLSYPQGDLGNDFTDAQRSGLKSFVESGGGLVSLHISPDSSPDWSEMKKLTGGGWVSGVSKHHRFGRLKVHIVNTTHPVTEGIDDFETEDELYTNMDLQPGIDTFMGTKLDGAECPLGWTTTYGEGKVVNIALGHSGASVGMPLDGHASTCLCPPRPLSPYQRLVLNAIDFVTR
jgi:type 1 glutamine amidotransferase